MQQRPTPRVTPLKRGEDTDSSLQSHIPGTGASVWGNRVSVAGGRKTHTHTVVGNDSHGRLGCGVLAEGSGSEPESGIWRSELWW